MSTDHKPKLRKEKARIMKAGHRVTAGEGRIDGNLNLSRAIGDLIYKKTPKLSLQEQAVTSFPDIKSYRMTEKTDFAVLGCDGIFE